MESIVVLMIEEEQPEGLSSRKLVAETAKHNVLTAYNPEAGLELLRRFPRVSAILVHAAILHRNPDILSQVKALAPSTPIILASPFGTHAHPGVGYVHDSHNPQELLQILEQLKSNHEI